MKSLHDIDLELNKRLLLRGNEMLFYCNDGPLFHQQIRTTSFYNLADGMLFQVSFSDRHSILWKSKFSKWALLYLVRLWTSDQLSLGKCSSPLWCRKNSFWWYLRNDKQNKWRSCMEDKLLSRVPHFPLYFNFYSSSSDPILQPQSSIRNLSRRQI